MRNSRRSAFLFCLIALVYGTSAKVHDVTLTHNGFLVQNPIGNAFYVDIGDTVRFIWQTGTSGIGTHSVQSDNLPHGATDWSFIIDSLSPAENIIIGVSGYHYFSIDGNTQGLINCRDNALPLRYFEFAILPYPSSENVVVATSDQIVLTQVDSLLQLPNSQRQMLLKGLLAHGSGGYNFNWSWRFQESRWLMVEAAEEVCDGWSTFVEDSLAYWVDFLGYFCPWSSRLEKEVFPLAVESSKVAKPVDFIFYPNPAQKTLFIRSAVGDGITITSVVISDMLGRRQTLVLDCMDECNIDVTAYSTGLYMIEIYAGNRIIKKKLILK